MYEMNALVAYPAINAMSIFILGHLLQVLLGKDTGGMCSVNMLGFLNRQGLSLCVYHELVE
jgi:hypothetical protein